LTAPPIRRVALVSGVARPPGIGRAVALRLARSGHSIVCADVVAEAPADTGAAHPDVFTDVVAEVEDVAQGLGAAIQAVPMTRTDQGAWHDLVTSALARFGRLDVCCPLNGVTGPDAGDGSLLDVSDGSWERALELNLNATRRLVAASARAMVDAKRPGAITVLSSQAALVAKAGVGVVGAARAAVDHLVAVWAKELGPSGIRINAVAPLAVAPQDRFRNPGLVALAEREGGSFADWVAQHIPLGRPQDADETAAVIEFLCSDAASFVSGVTIPVHGGALP
jgi:NAD(P)-dependent dehydrogenase (short-subunit alcohol dehydrogenase family)